MPLQSIQNDITPNENEIQQILSIAKDVKKGVDWLISKFNSIKDFFSFFYEYFPYFKETKTICIVILTIILLSIVFKYFHLYKMLKKKFQNTEISSTTTASAPYCNATTNNNTSTNTTSCVAAPNNNNNNINEIIVTREVHVQLADDVLGGSTATNQTSTDQKSTGINILTKFRNFLNLIN